MHTKKPPRRFTAGVDSGFDNPEADILSLNDLARHGHSFDARMAYTAPEPEFAGPSFCFKTTSY